MGGISAVELIWTAIAAFGLGLATVEAKIAHENLTFLIKNRFNGKRRIMGMGHRRRQILSAVIQLLWTVVGIGAMSAPDPDNQGVSVLAVMLIAASALIVVNSWLDRHDRKRLIRYWESVDLRHISERDKELEAGI